MPSAEESAQHLIASIRADFAEGTRRLLDGQITVDDAVAAFEHGMGDLSDATASARARYVFGRWLIGLKLLAYALPQLEIAERLLSPAASDDDATLLCLTLADLATCLYARDLDHTGALAVLDRAVDTLAARYLPAAAPARDATKVETVRALAESSASLSTVLTVISIRYGTLFAERHLFTSHRLRQAVQWAKTAFDLYLRTPTDFPDTSAALMAECTQLVREVWAAAFQLSESGETLDERALAPLEEAAETLLLSEGESRDPHSPHIALAVEGSDPVVAVRELTLLPETSLDEEFLRGLLAKLELARDSLGVALCKFMLGRDQLATYAVLKTEKTFIEARNLLEDAWKTISRQVAPGHAYRILAQVSLGEARLASNDLVGAKEHLLSILAEGAMAACPIELLVAPIVRLAACFPPQAAGAAIFFGKLGLRLILSLAHQLSSLSDLAAGIFAHAPLWEIVSLLASNGRIGEALQVQRVSEIIAASEGMQLHRWAEVDKSISLTQLEETQATNLEAAMREPSRRLRRQLKRIRLAVRQVEMAVAQEDEEYSREVAALGEKLRWARYAEIPEQPENTALISYFVCADTIRVALLSQHDATHFKLFERKIKETEIAQTVFDFLHAIQQRQETDDERPLREQANALYQMLIGDAMDVVLQRENIRRLLIAPTGALRFLPFGALHDGERYLLERYAMVLYPDFPVDLRATPPCPAGAALLGASFYGSGPAALPGVKEELDGVREVLRGVLAAPSLTLDRRDLRFDEESVKQAFDGSFNLIHVASHFNANPANLAQSTLWLGNEEQLTVAQLAELATQRSGVDLLVLSACSSRQPIGARRAGAYHSVAGLLHGMGARSVMATLWPVKDRSAGILMRAFYRYLFSDACIDKAEALRSAQLGFVAGDHGVDLAHPRHWAPFTLSGNWLPFDRSNRRTVEAVEGRGAAAGSRPGHGLAPHLQVKTM